MMRLRDSFSSARRLVPLLLLLLLVLCVPVQSALAAPADPTLTLDELSTKLESGTMTGYMKTVMQGYTIEQIPVTVEAVVEQSSGSLILFEATGSQIDRIGNIASGMSGSPVYVDDGGVDKLIGAVSYGDSFTMGGMGLATPIEYMTAVQSTYGTAPVLGPVQLDKPVKTTNGRVTSIVIARNAKAAARVDAAAGQSVMAPLGLIEIGGLRPQSTAYKTLAARFEKKGFNVRPAAGKAVWTGAASPDLEAGSSCAVLWTMGEAWFGAAGTVTYVDGTDVLMFGHPVMWVGPTEAVLTGGYVAGVWPSSSASYKLIAPRDIKGTVTQDRYWGVMGKVGQDADMIPVTTTASYPDKATIVDHSSVSQWLVSQPYYYDTAAMVTMYALTTANDVEYYAGSAETTTTVVVSDETGTYTLTRDNLWDSWDDVAWEASYDVDEALACLADDMDGVLEPRIDSITLDAAISPTHRTARLAGVELPEPLHTGDNTIVIKFYAYGSTALDEITGTLTLPEGTDPNGSLSVYPGSQGGSYGYEDDYEYASAEAPQTLAEIVDAFNTAPLNSDLIVSFMPNSADDESGAIESRIATDYVFSDEYYANTAPIEIEVMPRTVNYGGSVMVAGSISDATGDVPVSIYRLDAGRTAEVLVGTVTAKASDGVANFETEVTGLKRTTRLIAKASTVGDYLPGSDSAKVKVRARVTIATQVKGHIGTLTVRVQPTAAAGKVLLERRLSGRWQPWKAGNRAAGGTTQFKVGPGTFVVRARFLGGSICVGGVSKAATVRVK